MVFLDRSKKGLAIHAGHVQIGDNNVDRFAFDDLQCGLTTIGNSRGKPYEGGNKLGTNSSPEGRGCREAAGEGYGNGTVYLPLTRPFGPPSPFGRGICPQSIPTIYD